MSEKMKNETSQEAVRETMEIIAKENFEKWNDALQTKDAKKVAELYTEDTTFLPTLSGEFKKGRAAAEKYFEHFLKKNPVGEIVNGAVKTIKINGVAHGGYYSHSGMYNFEVDSDEGEGRHIIEARFSFEWQKDDQGKWKISHHHSSLKPEEKK